MSGIDKKRILFILPTFGIGGAEKSLIMLLFALSKYDCFDVNVMLFKNVGVHLKQIPKNINLMETEHSLKLAYSPFELSNIKTYEDLKISIVRLFGTFITAILAGNKRKKKQTRWKYFYKKIIRDLPGEYDYACGYLDGEANYYVIDKVSAKKKFLWNQNDYSKIGSDRKFDLPYFEKADKIITLSDVNYSILTDCFPNQKDKTLIIPPIVIPEYIAECANEYAPPEFERSHGRVLVSVGRLIDQKGFDIAIEAARLLKEKNLDFSWYIIGNGIRYKKLNDQIKKCGVEDSVFLIGERENPYPYIKNAEIFIQPSRYEAKSVILTEAKMLCRPILVTNFATACTQITDGVNGKIVEMNSIALVEGIEFILESEYSQVYVENLKKEVAVFPSSLDQYLELFDEKTVFE